MGGTGEWIEAGAVTGRVSRRGSGVATIDRAPTAEDKPINFGVQSFALGRGILVHVACA